MTKRLAVITAALAMLMTCGCSWWNQRMINEHAKSMTGGDPESGKIAIQHYACAGCHTIPGIQSVPGAAAKKGPSLEHWFDQKTIAQKVPNTPENLVEWIQQPNEVVPGTQMPNLGVTEQQARDIAAYLYTLR